MGYEYKNQHGRHREYTHKSNNQDIEKQKRAEELIKMGMVENPNWREILRDGGPIDEYSKNLDIKTTQIRKFFEEVRKIRDRLHDGNAEWTEIESELWKLIPAARYASGRKVISKDFYYFISKGIYMATEPDSEEAKKRKLENFIRLFEALVAFHKFHNPD